MLGFVFLGMIYFITYNFFIWMHIYLFFILMSSYLYYCITQSLILYNFLFFIFFFGVGFTWFYNVGYLVSSFYCFEYVTNIFVYYFQ